MAPTTDSLKSLLTRSVLLAARDTSFADYSSRASDSINVLNAKFYNVDTGIWDNAWWNSGNAFTMLADYAALDIDGANAVNVGGYLWNTYNNAQRTDRKVRKDISSADGGLVHSTYTLTRRYDEYSDDEYGYDSEGRPLHARGFAGFVNEYYDDEGWWALGLLRAWDVTRTQEYLDSAVSIFTDMKTGGNTNCGGGIYWNKDRKYVNAIANELYLAVAAGLANRVPDDQKSGYLDIATAQWAWFKDSGMFADDGLINDGLNDECKNNGAEKWTYNQGVVLGGLAELWRATGNTDLLDAADKIALAAIKIKATDAGILSESCEPNCGADGDQFKGVFARNLGYLHQARPRDEYKTFILANADSIWASDRSDDGRHGTQWDGPASAGNLNGPSHSSALDALVAALVAA